MIGEVVVLSCGINTPAFVSAMIDFVNKILASMPIDPVVSQKGWYISGAMNVASNSLERNASFFTSTCQSRVLQALYEDAKLDIDSRSAVGYSTDLQSALISLMDDSLQNRLLNLRLMTWREKAAEQTGGKHAVGNISAMIDSCVDNLNKQDGVESTKARNAVLAWTIKTVDDLKPLIAYRIEELCGQIKDLYSSMSGVEVSDKRKEVEAAFEDYSHGISKMMAFLRCDELEDQIDDLSMYCLNLLADRRRSSIEGALLTKPKLE